MSQTLLDPLIEIIEKALSVLRALRRVGKKELIRQLEGLIDSAERFRKAIDGNDASALNQCFHEYSIQVRLLKKRLFQVIDDSLDKELSNLCALVEMHDLLYLEEIYLRDVETMKRPPWLRPWIGDHSEAMEQLKLELEIGLDAAIGHLRGLAKGLSAELSAP